MSSSLFASAPSSPDASRHVSEAVVFVIAHTWDGVPVGPDEAARAEIRRIREDDAADDGGLLIRVEAPFHGDPPPDAPPGPTPGLWEHEVVEVFLAGPGDDAAVPYLEVELSPWGHHLVLQLEGVRRVVAPGLPVDYAYRRPDTADEVGGTSSSTSSRGTETGSDEVGGTSSGTSSGNWVGEARIPAAYLPPGPWRANAYALHGAGDARRYLAAYPVPPTSENSNSENGGPDFHQPSLFRPLELPPLYLP